MMASTHVVFGMTCWAVFERMHGVSILSSPETMMVAGVASLLPDIDHPKSKFGRLVPFLSYPISATFGHRGITHSLLMVVAMMIALFAFGHHGWFLPPLVIGYLSHLMGDMLTNSGVPLLWPQRGKVSIPVFNTGSILEPVVRVGLVVVLAAMIWQSRGLPLH